MQRVLLANPVASESLSEFIISEFTERLQSFYANDYTIIPASVGWRDASSTISGSGNDRFYGWAEYVASSVDVYDEPIYDEVWIPDLLSLIYQDSSLEISSIDREEIEMDVVVGKGTALIIASCLQSGKSVKLVGSNSLNAVVDIDEIKNSEDYSKFAVLKIDWMDGEV